MGTALTVDPSWDRKDGLRHGWKIADPPLFGLPQEGPATWLVLWSCWSPCG